MRLVQEKDMPKLYMVIERFRNGDAIVTSKEAAERVAPRL
jgi:hypothetical protein